MNAAALNNSPRLQRVAALLESGGKFTTLDIVQQANVCAVNSCIAELRANGIEINCQRKGDVWLYSMPEKLNYQPPRVKHWEDKSRYNSFHREG
jgi:hypothetical protein